MTKVEERLGSINTWLADNISLHTIAAVAGYHHSKVRDMDRCVLGANLRVDTGENRLPNGTS